jgi:hypothetical protein
MTSFTNIDESVSRTFMLTLGPSELDMVKAEIMDHRYDTLHAVQYFIARSDCV